MPVVSWGPRVYDFFVSEPTTNNHFSCDLMEYEEIGIVNLESRMDVEQVIIKILLIYTIYNISCNRDFRQKVKEWQMKLILFSFSFFLVRLIGFCLLS